jgi:hypothetical protein
MVQYDLLASGASFTLALYFYLKSRRYEFTDRLPLPPGPKKLPLIGNLLDMPTSFEWMTYHKWCKEFGAQIYTLLWDAILTLLADSDIIHLNMGGTSLIVLDTSEATTELLERRSSVYSDRYRLCCCSVWISWNIFCRARMPMINELMGWHFNFGFMKYGAYMMLLCYNIFQ